MSSPRIIYAVRWHKRTASWRVYIGKREAGRDFDTKREAVEMAAHWARDRAGDDRTVTQLRVFNKDGRIAFERTYPRSSDPERSKG